MLCVIAPLVLCCDQCSQSYRSRAISTPFVTAVVRERDELIARMDAKERLDYDRESNQNYRNTADSVENSLAEVNVQNIELVAYRLITAYLCE